MRLVPKISASEWEIMKVLWAQAPCTANEIVGALREHDWTPPTIRTLINRLVKKGAVAHSKAASREYHYAPLFTQEECARHERRSFLHRIYNGATQPMLAHLLQDEELSTEEAEALKRILNRKTGSSS